VGGDGMWMLWLSKPAPKFERGCEDALEVMSGLGLLS
jgi:hypothetical protein